MSVQIEKFAISSRGFDDLIDITSKVQGIVSSMNIKMGMINLVVDSPCTSLTTLEIEKGLSSDLLNILESIVPLNKVYNYDEMWHEGNAHAHLKAAIIGNSITLPIIDGLIQLAKYQKIILIDFDNKTASKQITLSVLS